MEVKTSDIDVALHSLVLPESIPSVQSSMLVMLPVQASHPLQIDKCMLPMFQNQTAATTMSSEALSLCQQKQALARQGMNF